MEVFPVHADHSAIRFSAKLWNYFDLRCRLPETLSGRQLPFSSGYRGYYLIKSFPINELYKIVIYVEKELNHLRKIFIQNV